MRLPLLAFLFYRSVSYSISSCDELEPELELELDASSCWLSELLAEGASSGVTGTVASTSAAI